MPIAAIAFGFSVMALSLANTETINIQAGIFVPIAFETGALGMLVGGLREFRNGNLIGATFATANACFLFTTALMLRWFAPDIAALASGRQATAWRRNRETLGRRPLRQ